MCQLNNHTCVRHPPAVIIPPPVVACSYQIIQLVSFSTFRYDINPCSSLFYITSKRALCIKIKMYVALKLKMQLHFVSYKFARMYAKSKNHLTPYFYQYEQTNVKVISYIDDVLNKCGISCIILIIFFFSNTFYT